MPDVRISYTTQDFIAAQKLSARRSWRKKTRWVLLGAASVAAITVLTLATDPQKRGEMVMIASGLLPVALIAGLWLAQRVSIVLNGRRTLHAFPALRAEFTYSALPEGLRQRSQYGEATVKWNEIAAFSEDDESWLIYPTFMKSQSYLLPKRCLTPEFTSALEHALAEAGAPRR